MKRALLILFMTTNAWALSYRQVFDAQGQVSTKTIQRVDDGAFIPTETTNRDYREYLDWIAAGNTILPGIPVLTPTQVNETIRGWALNDLLTSQDSQAVLMRAILLVLLDENNVTRGWIADFKTAVAASTSLADLKTRVAALPAMPDRTAAQFKTAVQNKINAGAAD